MSIRAAIRGAGTDQTPGLVAPPDRTPRAGNTAKTGGTTARNTMPRTRLIRRGDSAAAAKVADTTPRDTGV